MDEIVVLYTKELSKTLPEEEQLPLDHFRFVSLSHIKQGQAPYPRSPVVQSTC